MSQLAESQHSHRANITPARSPQSTAGAAAPEACAIEAARSYQSTRGILCICAELMMGMAKLMRPGGDIKRPARNALGLRRVKAMRVSVSKIVGKCGSIIPPGALVRLLDGKQYKARGMPSWPRRRRAPCPEATVKTKIISRYWRPSCLDGRGYRACIISGSLTRRERSRQPAEIIALGNLRGHRGASESLAIK